MRLDSGMSASDASDPAEIPECDQDCPNLHWDRIRDVSPLVWSSKRQAWLVLSHQLAIATYSHPALTSSAYVDSRPSPLPLRSSFEEGQAEHRHIQRAIASCVGRKALPMDLIQSGCRDLVESAPLGQAFDFSAALAEPIAFTLTQRWFAFDERFLFTLIALFRAAAMDEDSSRRAAAARLAVQHLSNEIAVRRLGSGTDLLSRLAMAWSAQGLDDESLIAFVAPMIHSLATGIGGKLITHTVLHLLDRPNIQDLIRSDGWATARAAASEAARLDPVNQGSPRAVLRRLSLAGRVLSPGEKLWVVLPAVCRDPAVHSVPHEFRLWRAERHLAFGQGGHACTGRELALAVAATALTELLSNHALEIRPAADSAQFDTNFGRSCIRLPVILQRAAA